MSFGEFLRARRLASGRTIVQMADAADISPTLLRRHESPHRPPPKPTHQAFYAGVAKALGITEATLRLIAAAERAAPDDGAGLDAPLPEPQQTTGRLAAMERAQFVRHIARLNREIERLRVQCGEEQSHGQTQ